MSITSPKPCLKKPKANTTKFDAVAVPKSVTFPEDDYIATCIKTGQPLSVDDGCHSDMEEKPKTKECIYHRRHLPDEYYEAEDEAEYAAFLEMASRPGQTAEEKRAVNLEALRLLNLEIMLDLAKKAANKLRRKSMRNGSIDFALHVKCSFKGQHQMMDVVDDYPDLQIGSFRRPHKHNLYFKKSRSRFSMRLPSSRYVDSQSSMSAEIGAIAFDTHVHPVGKKKKSKSSKKTQSQSQSQEEIVVQKFAVSNKMDCVRVLHLTDSPGSVIDRAKETPEEMSTMKQGLVACHGGVQESQ